MLKGNTVFAITAPFSSASGTLVSSDLLLLPNSGGVMSGVDNYDSGQYIIQTGAGVSAGAVSVQLLTMSSVGSPVWITATTPNSATGAAFTLIATLGATATYNGSLGVAGSVFFPCIGIRLSVSGLTGGNITLAHLILTKR